jgi:cobalt-zinc-cadmium efflux system protein
MGHGHSHHHGPGADADAKRIAIALGLIVGFMCVEVVTAIVAHSLALFSDAAHMLTDAAALALSLVAARLATRPAKGALTYGFGRVEILSAQINGITLLILAILIIVEAISRLISPPHVRGGLVLAVALVGIVVNVAAVRVLAGANRDSLNVEGSFQHILTDLFSFIGTALAAIVILTTGWVQADAIASLFVAALMLRSASGLLMDSGRVFLEASPRKLSPEEIGRALAAQDGVAEVHDLHVWEVTSGFPALSAHIVVGHGTDCHGIRADLERMLHDEFGLDHTTLQVEHEPALLKIEPQGSTSPSHGRGVSSPS